MWVRVDDRFPRHPKVLAAGEALGHRTDGTARVMTLFISALCYSAEHLTDGVISHAALGTMRQQVWNPHRVAEVIADAGLFDRRPDGSYLIHDYHHYNPTSTEIKDKRARDSARKRGGVQVESEQNPERSRARDPVPSRPVPSEKENIPPRRDEEWERFKTAYPGHRRQGGYMANQRFLAACEAVGFSALLEALERHKRSEDWQKGFVPSLEKWFEKELWIQTPETVEQTQADSVQASLAHLHELDRRKAERS